MARYYPHDLKEEAFIRWLEGPGDDLGMFLGVGPTIEQRIVAAQRRQRAQRAKRGGRR
jgi:hypothetical protein